jgi:hypothetical protein
MEDDLFIAKSGEWKSSTVTVLGSVCACKFSNICLMKLGMPKFATYMLAIVISF